MFHAIEYQQGEEHSANKKDNPYSHELLYETNYKRGDYIDVPRGRVVYDEKNSLSIIYIDKCINKENIIKKIVKSFDIKSYTVEQDLHYHCKNCVKDIWDEMWD